MSQPLLRLKVCAQSSDASGGASDIDQAPEMWPPRQRSPQLLRDRGMGDNGRPVFKAHDGAVVDRANWPLRLLVVADDSAARHQITDYLESHHMRTTSATRREALRQLTASEPDMIVLDTRLCPADGLDLLRDVRLVSDVPLIIAGRHQGNKADQMVTLI